MALTNALFDPPKYANLGGFMFTNHDNSNTITCIQHSDGSADTIMTVAEVAKFLRVHRSTVSRLAKSGELPSHKIGNRRLFKASDVWEFFDNKIVTGKGGC